MPTSPEERPNELPVVQASPPPGLDLPLFEATVHERADAARNRIKVLAAAEELFRSRGPDCVTMDAIAAAAGVGKGTLFRRFGDRAGLARSLLDVQERRLQEHMIRGEPPLGPGAPAPERIVAFGCALLAFTDEQRAILRAAEAGGARLRHPAYAVHRSHLTLLVREANPELDAEYVADALLASLSAELVAYLRDERGMDAERLHAGWTDLVGRLLR